MQELFLGLLGLLVVVSGILGRPKRLAASSEFPAPLGAKVIAWASLGVWLLLIIGSVTVEYYRLALALTLGPLYTIWRWPETIQIDELRTPRSAWFHRDVSMLWCEIESITLGRSGDSVMLRSRDGDKIAISASQVGAGELAAEIRDRTGIPFPKWEIKA